MITPVLLVILDGWGYSEQTEFNAIHSAHTPTWDALWETCPHTLLNASGAEAGLPERQMGNSEVGHTMIGAGRVVPQEFTRIRQAIQDGSFFRNETLTCAFAEAARRGSGVHVLGLLSPGGVHGHEDHIFALLELAKTCGVTDLFLHAFLDGRDTSSSNAAESIRRAQEKCAELKVGRIATLIGRYYAMDRNQNWGRTATAYHLIATGKADYQYPDALIALDEAYRRGESDEFVRPVAVQCDRPYVGVRDGDVLVFANYRADRARQLTRAFTKQSFTAFERGHVPRLGAFISLTEYKTDYNLPIAFPPERVVNGLGECVSRLGLKQLRIAETEKYAHVTFFFSGGEERAFEGETRTLVPSPRVATYDRAPEMSALPITRKLVRAIDSGDYRFIVCNYANADMVGHTGDLQATIAAVETIDDCLSRLLAAVRRRSMDMIVTADHGNAEQLGCYITEKVKPQTYKAHTSNPVPFVYVGRNAEIAVPAPGSLADVAPTVLYLMGLEPPREMTGRVLVQLQREQDVQREPPASTPVRARSGNR